MFADDGGKQPLIDVIAVNLSQTPREQCELKGLISGSSNLCHSGPGQSIIVHGLVNQQELNGCTGRVLPLSGRGSLMKPAVGPRIAVRLTTMKAISCQPQKIKYHAISNNPSAAASNTHSPGVPLATANPARHDAAAQPSIAALPVPTGALAKRVRSVVRSSNCRMLIIRMALTGSDMPEAAITCTMCKDSRQEGYVALARTQGLSRKPQKSLVRLQCVDCLIRAAQAEGVAADVESVESFLESHCMWPCEACNILMENPRSYSVGPNGTKENALY